VNADFMSKSSKSGPRSESKMSIGYSESSNKETTASSAFCSLEGLKPGLCMLIRVKLALSEPLEG